MKRTAAVALLAAAAVAHALEAQPVPPFSPAGVALVRDADATVLQVRSDASAGAARAGQNAAARFGEPRLEARR